MERRTPVRAALAITAARRDNWLSRRTGRGSGTVAGGRVGLRLAPQLLSTLARGRDVILVTGTNGKTTTSALVREGWGQVVAANATGANMPAGHVAALIDSSSNAVVLETDEAWLATVIEQTAPRVIVLLNLSRDQLDRASEVRQLAERWRVALAKAKGCTVVANASDPLVVYAAELAPTVTWIQVPSVWQLDAQSCPHCTSPLRFDGTWSCECGFHEPTATVRSEGTRAWFGEDPIELTLAIPGAFNFVNATFALVALEVVGVPRSEASARLASLTSVQGRYGRRQWRGRELRLLLAKNPAGVAALLAPGADLDDEVWVAINAQIADGKDPSWLYDAPFEQLKGHQVMCLGERRLDLATRLEADGVTATVVDDVEVLALGQSPVTLIANYTAFRYWLGESTPC